MTRLLTNFLLEKKHNQIVLRLEKLEEFASIILKRKQCKFFLYQQIRQLKNCERRNSFYETSLNSLGSLFFWR